MESNIDLIEEIIAEQTPENDLKFIKNCLKHDRKQNSKTLKQIF